MNQQATNQINEIISKNTDNCVLITDNEGYTIWANNGFTKLSGYHVEDILGKKPGDILQGPNTDKKTTVLIKEALNSEKEFRCEILNYTKNKVPYWVELRIFPFKNPEGETNFFGISKNITEKVLRKSPQMESENIHRLLLENSNEVISLHNLDSTIVYVSPSCKKVFGYSQAELIGEALHKYIQKDDHKRIKEEVSSLSYSNKKIPAQTYRFNKSDGSQIWLESSISIIKNDTGNIIQAQLLTRDVTEKVHLLKEMEFQTNILKNISDTVITCDVNGMVNYWSKSAEKLHGMKAEEVIGKPLSTFDPVFNFEKFKKEFKKYTSTPYRHRWEFVRNDKTKIWIDTTVTALQDFNGNFSGGIGVGKNITELIESKMRLDIAVDSADLGLWERNVIEKTNLVNEKWCSMLGYQKEEVDETQDFFEKLIHKDDLPVFKNCLKNIHRDKEHVIDITIRLKNKLGDYLWINGKGKAVEFSEDGNPTRIIGTHQDVTKQIELTEFLKETNELANVGGWQMNLFTGKFSATEGIKKIHNIDNPAEKGLELFQQFHKKDKELVEAKFKKLVETGEGYDLELKLTDTNDTEKWVRSIAKAEMLDGKVINVYGALQDITAKKRMEERLKVTGDIAKVGGWEINELTGESLLTDHVYEIYGLPIGTPLPAGEGIKFYHPDDLPIITEAYSKLVKEGTPYNIEVRFIDANGKSKWIRTLGRCEKKGEKIVRTFGSFQDITEYKRLENLLEITNSMAKVGGVEIDISNGNVMVTDEVRKIFEVNQDFKFHMDNRYKFYSEDSWKQFEPALNRLVKDGKEIDLILEVRTLKKNKKWVRILGKSELKDGKVNRLLGSMQDVTDQINNKHLIEKSVQALNDVRHALDVSSIVAITDKKGTITYVNDAFVDISGYSKEELIGENHRIINSNYHTKAFFKKLWSTISSGEIWKGEIKNKKKNGKYYWVDTTIVPIFNNNKKPEQYIAIRNDITERKKFQERLEILNKKLEDKVKERTADLELSNQELRTFNYMISHDLRTPLRAVNIFASQLKNKLQKIGVEDELIQDLEFINSGVNEMNRLISDLLEYARLRNSKLRLKKANLKPLINSHFKENQALYSDLEAELKVDNFPPLEIDETLFTHVISNLIGNTFKYASNDKNLVVNIQYKREDNFHKLTFTDNGIGFDSNHAEDIFKPFKRLVGYNHSEGSGLGLSICMRIIQQHGGEIWAESEEGYGAKFHIKLPIEQMENV